MANMCEQRDDSRADLPPEIWRQVLEHLPDEQFSILTAFCLTSKYMRGIAEPLLYRKWEFATRGVHPIHDFAYVVLSKPRLAGFVRELVTELQPSNDRTLFHDGSNSDAQELRRYQSSWRPKEAVSAYLWSEARKYGLAVPDAKAVDIGKMNDISIKLLCLLLPNLDKLIVHTGLWSELRKFFDETVEARASVPRRMIGPKEISIQHTRYRYGGCLGPDLALFTGLFSLPRLRIIELRGFHYIENPQLTRRKAPPLESVSCKSVKVLRMFESYLTVFDLAQIFRAFPNLEDFEYSVGKIEGVAGFHGSQAVAPLTALSKTLKRLSLDLEVQPGRNIYRREDVISSFTGLLRLEDLIVEGTMIMAQRNEKLFLENGNSSIWEYRCPFERDNSWMNYFPASLKTLSIIRVYRNIEEPLKELADNVQDWLPHLAFLHVNLGTGKDYADREEADESGYKDMSQPILTDGTLQTILNQEYADEEMVELNRRTGQYQEIIEKRWMPKRFIRGNSISVAMTTYLREGAELKHLPQPWQDIFIKFKDSSIRVEVENSFVEKHPRPDKDMRGPMLKFAWQPHSGDDWFYAGEEPELHSTGVASIGPADGKWYHDSWLFPGV